MNFDRLQSEPRITRQWGIAKYNDPWSHDFEIFKARKQAGTTIPKKYTLYGYDLETGEYATYTSKAECARIIGVPVDTVYRGVKLGKGMSKRYFAALSKERLAKIVKDGKMLKVMDTAPIFIVAVDTFDDTVSEFNSQNETAKAFGVSSTSVKYALAKNILLSGRYKLSVKTA